MTTFSCITVIGLLFFFHCFRVYLISSFRPEQTSRHIQARTSVDEAVLGLPDTNLGIMFYDY